MTLDQKLEKVKNLLEQIQKVYDGLGDTNPFQGIDPNTIAASNKEIDKLEIALTGITKNASDLEKGFGGIAASIGASLAEMNKQNNVTNRTVKAMRSLSSISESLKHDQSGLSKLSLKELESKRDKAKILSQEARSQAVLVKQKYEAMTSDKNGNQLYGAALDARLEKLIRNKTISKSELQTINEIIAAEKEKFPILDELNAKIEERIKKEKEVNKTMGLTKVALEGLGKIPIVGPLLDTNKALDAARTKAEAGGNALQSLGVAAGSMGKSLVSSFTDPLVVIGLLVKGFQMFLDIGFAADKQITDLSKSMAVSHEEASATRDRMVEIQNSGKDIFMTTKNQVEAQMELASAMGATRGFTEQQIADQVLLTKKMGLTAEEAGGIQMLAASNGITAKNVTNSIIKQTSALAKQTGIQLDNKQVVQEVAKVSGQLRLQYANNPKLIAKAVVETKKLGINMEIAANAAKGLLQFEDSIENELSAELLTGKALNLERARGLALNGDSVGAAKEMLAQVGSAADFQNMNVIQQEAIAKAVGMSTDDLANSLVTQENLKKLGDETRNQIEEKIKAAKALGTEEGDSLARQLESSIGDEKAAQDALEKVSAQESFNQSIETLKSMLASIVEGPAGDFANWIGDSEEGANRLKSVFEGIKAVIALMAGLMVGKIVFGLTTQLGLMIAQNAIAKAMQASAVAELGIKKAKKAASIAELGTESAIAGAKVVGAEASTLGAATPFILGGIAAVMAIAGAYMMMNKGGSVPGTNTKSDSVPALLTSGEYVIPNSNGKTGTEKYNEMISPKTPVMLNEGGTVSINSNKGNLTPSLPPDNKGNNQDLTSLIPAINSLQNNIKSLIQIHIDFLKELKLILTPITKIPTKETPIKNETSLVKIPTKETPIKNETSSLVPLFTNFLKELKLILTPPTKIPTKETNLTKETSLKKEVTPLDLLNVLNPFSTMLKVGSLLLSKSIETKNNSIKPIENNSIESKQTNIDQNVVKPIGDNTTTPKQNNIDQNVNKSTTFSLFNFQNDTSKSDTGVIQAINGLRSDLKALASRPIHTSVQLDGKELATMQGKYPNEAGDANGKVAYQMS